MADDAPRKSFWERLEDDYQAVLRFAKGQAAARPLIEPNRDEARNGWDAESLTAYVAHREAAQALILSPIHQAHRLRPRIAKHVFNPHRHWKRRP